MRSFLNYFLLCPSTNETHINNKVRLNIDFIKNIINIQINLIFVIFCFTWIGIALIFAIIQINISSYCSHVPGRSVYRGLPATFGFPADAGRFNVSKVLYMGFLLSLNLSNSPKILSHVELKLNGMNLCYKKKVNKNTDY